MIDALPIAGCVLATAFLAHDAFRRWLRDRSADRLAAGDLVALNARIDALTTQRDERLDKYDAAFAKLALESRDAWAKLNADVSDVKKNVNTQLAGVAATAPMRGFGRGG